MSEPTQDTATLTDEVPSQTSDLRQELINAGAEAQTVDVAAMLAQMKAMQAQIDALNVERGVPANPIEGAVKNLVDHVKARAAQLPHITYSELLATLEKLPEAVTADHASLIGTLVDDLVENHAAVAHELGYLPQLARDLKKAVLQKVTA